MPVKVLARPVKIISGIEALEQEMRSARWLHHRLLDFEYSHQALIDATADEILTGSARDRGMRSSLEAMRSILARLKKRSKRRSKARAGQWTPNPHEALQERLREHIDSIKSVRNSDPRWRAALNWADDPVGDVVSLRRRRAKDPAKIKRRKKESDEAFAKRFALLTNDETDEHFAAKAGRRRTRRDQYAQELYSEHSVKTQARSRVLSGTWNRLRESVKQAVDSVKAERKNGKPAEWKRPRWDSPITLRIDSIDLKRNLKIERGVPWWTFEMRTCFGWVKFRAKCARRGRELLAEGSDFVEFQLTRRKGPGFSWHYSMALTARVKEETNQSGYIAAFDWGHREYGHARAHEGIRAFSWVGNHPNDSAKGELPDIKEVILSKECRDKLDEIDRMKSRLDEAYSARKETFRLTPRNRHGYRKQLRRSGVLTREESDWLAWETRYERRLFAHRKRIDSLKREVYNKTIAGLKQRYQYIALEDIAVKSLRAKAKEDEQTRRKRQNRELVSFYEFYTFCEQSGLEVITVPARNSSKECPYCGQPSEKTAEVLITCPRCGRTRDRDHGAACVLLARAREALANPDATQRKERAAA